jgi:hypothetical protein
VVDHWLFVQFIAVSADRPLSSPCLNSPSKTRFFSPTVHEAIIPQTVTFFTLLDAVNADLQPDIPFAISEFDGTELTTSEMVINWADKDTVFHLRPDMAASFSAHFFAIPSSGGRGLGGADSIVSSPAFSKRRSTMAKRINSNHVSGGFTEIFCDGVPIDLSI